MKPVNWGILSTGWIAHEFCKALKTVPEAAVVAVASRNMQSAEAFAAQHGIPACYDTYEALMKDPRVDIVYIGSPNGLHRAHVLACLNAGKHVLCEKPAGINAQEAKAMVQAARDNGKFFMEAMWTRFFPAMQQAKAWCDEGKIGALRLIRAECSAMETDKNKWLWDPTMHGGCLNDVGIYPVSLVSWFFGKQPSSISSTVLKSERGVDVFSTIGFAYGDAMASLSCALPLTTDGSAYICGEYGYIHIPGFSCAKEAILYEHGKEPVRFCDDYPGNGYQYEAQAVTAYIQNGYTDAPLMPMAESIAISETMDAIRAGWK